MKSYKYKKTITLSKRIRKQTNPNPNQLKILNLILTNWRFDQDTLSHFNPKNDGQENLSKVLGSKVGSQITK